MHGISMNLKWENVTMSLLVRVAETECQHDIVVCWMEFCPKITKLVRASSSNRTEFRGWDLKRRSFTV